MRLWPNWERRKDDLREELEAHLRLAIEERIASGESPEAARAAALREMGNPPLVADVTRSAWGWQWFERIVQDARFAFRQLAKSPGYTAALITTLALGLGAVTTMMAVVDSVLLRPVALPRSQQIMLLNGENRHEGTSAYTYALSYKQVDSLRSGLRYFSQLSAYNTFIRPVRAEDGARISLTVEASPNLFALLGVRAQMGRLLGSSDANAQVLVVNNAFWRDRLHADPHAIGKSVTLLDRAWTVIGVLPAGFSFPQSVGDFPAVYLPITLNAKGEDELGLDSASVIARLKDGTTIQQARQEAQSFYAHANPESASKHDSLKMQPYLNFITGDIQKSLYALLAAVGVLLLIACANAANLQIGRAASRMEEMQIRSALGASFRCLTQQLLVESCMVSLAGAVLGGAMSYGAVAIARKAYSAQFARFDELAVHPTVLVACALLAALVGIAATLAPMLSVWRQMRTGVICTGTRTVTRVGRLPGLLVSLQVALTCMLLATCGLFARTFYALQQVKLGFDPHGVTTLVLVPENHLDSSAAKQIEAQLLRRMQSLPGIESVAIQTSLPFSSFDITLNGTTDVQGRIWHEGDSAYYSMVSTDFVRASGIRLLRGRAFTSQDETYSGGSVSIIVNEAFVQKFLDGHEPIGASAKFHRNPGETDADIPFTQTMNIVGVVENELQGGDLGAPYQPMVYLNFLQLPTSSLLGQAFNMSVQYAVRSHLPQSTLTAELRSAIKQEAPQMVEMGLVSMESAIASSLNQRRLALRLAGGFGIFALALSAVGIYGVLAYAVTLRRKEIGVRLALGATRQNVIGIVMRQAGMMTLLGLLPGLAGAWAAGHAIRSFLFGVKALDAITLAAVGLMLIVVSALAAFLPARRAAAVDPMEALRFE